MLRCTCAHFIVDRNGRIYPLVRLDVMCRHTVGLDYVAIGTRRGSSIACTSGSAA